MYKIKNYSHKFFLCLYVIMPLIDSINGFFINEGISSFSSLGQLYRILMLLLMMFIVYNKEGFRKSYVSVFIFVGYFLIATLLHIAVGSAVSVSEELRYSFQWIYAFLIIWYFSRMIYCHAISSSDIDMIISCFSWLAPLTIIVPYILGIGYSTYSSSGYKGFYYANNGISYLCSVLVIIELFKFLNKFSPISFIRFCMIALTCVLLGTKSPLLAVIIAFIFAACHVFDDGIIKGAQRVIVLMMGFIAGCILIFQLFYNKMQSLFERLFYLYKLYGGSIADAISSGRTEKLQTMWKSIFEQNITQNLVIGQGAVGIISEMDVFDYFYYFGLIGVILALLFIRKLHHIMCPTTNSLYYFILVFSLVYSFIVGHVFSNSLSVMTFVLILGKLVKPSKNPDAIDCI